MPEAVSELMNLSSALSLSPVGCICMLADFSRSKQEAVLPLSYHAAFVRLLLHFESDQWDDASLSAIEPILLQMEDS